MLSMLIPVYITNRDRLTAPKKLVEWLLVTKDVGQITILDNDTTYPPVLDWYETLHDVVVTKMNRNGGPWVFWELEMQKSQPTPYIVTDSDMVPSDGCPDDIIEKMRVLLETYFHL